MFCIGSRTYYAEYHGIIFNFEYKRDRDYFVAHAKDAKIIAAKEAYDKNKLKFLGRIKVECSNRIGANPDRKRRIKEWYENK